MMRKLRTLALFLVVLLTSAALQARAIPPDMQVAKFQSLSYPHVRLASSAWRWGQTYDITPITRVRNLQHHFEQRGELGRYVGHYVAVRTLNRAIVEMWILSPEEYQQLKDSKR